MSPKQLGVWGELYAQKYLQKHGYTITHYNWRYSRRGEIDIIALKDNITVFLEVKTRRNINNGTPIEAVSQKKYQQIRKCISYYITDKNLKDLNFQFDIIGIFASKNNIQLKHVKNVLTW